jgi:hypothetical protein
MTSGKLVAKGIFTWDGVERREGRYGAFVVSSEDYAETATHAVFHDKKALLALEDKRVRIRCKAIATRKSGHVGDLFRNIKPETPDVGEVIDLGVGTLQIEIGFDGSPAIALKPADGRDEHWYDPWKLYRLHDQTVEVYIEETQDAFSPAPVIDVEEEGTIAVDGAAFQTRGKMPKAIQPTITRLGDGLFAIGPQTITPGKRVKTNP